MLDEKDLQAIQGMIDLSEQRIAKNTIALMDAKFGPWFSLLAEGQQDILQKLKKAN